MGTTMMSDGGDFYERSLNEFEKQRNQKTKEEEHAMWLLDNGETKRYDYNLNNESFIIDLGGYKGAWADSMYKRYECSILIFEPVKSFYEDIAEKFRYNKNITVRHSALGNENRTDMISVAGDAASIFTGEKNEEINVIDIFEQFKFEGIKSVDLMKINIEGSEYEVLERMIESGMIDMVDNFQIQFHDFIPNCSQRRDFIINELSKTHKCDWSYTWVWENWSKI